MKILILQASPRANGNTAWMAEEYKPRLTSKRLRKPSRKWFLSSACYSTIYFINEDIRKHHLGCIRRPAHSFGVFLRRTDTDDHHHRHPLRLAESKTGYAGHLAVWYESEMEGVATRLSEHLHECAVVLRGRYLDMAHPRLLRSHILHHDYWHPVWKDALPTGKAGSFTFWERIRLTGRTAE